MKLLLTSAGVTNKTISDALLQLLGKPFVESRLAFIPTAANVEEGDKTWVEDDIQNFKDLGFKVDVVDIAAIIPEIWKPRLERAEVLVFGGGNNAYLASCLSNLGLKELLPELLETRIYVGISAGSCVAGHLSSRANLDIYQEEIKYAVDDPGLRYAPFIFMPHLNSDFFPMVGKKHLQALASETSEAIYALDDQGAISISDSQLKIVTEGEYLIFNK